MYWLLLLRNTSHIQVHAPCIILKNKDTCYQQSTHPTFPCPTTPGHFLCQSIPQWIPVPSTKWTTITGLCDFFCAGIYHIYFVYYICVTYTHAYVLFPFLLISYVFIYVYRHLGKSVYVCRRVIWLSFYIVRTRFTRQSFITCCAQDSPGIWPSKAILHWGSSTQTINFPNLGGEAPEHSGVKPKGFGVWKHSGRLPCQQHYSSFFMDRQCACYLMVTLLT